MWVELKGSADEEELIMNVAQSAYGGAYIFVLS